jgi:hypothetical protein
MSDVKLKCLTNSLDLTGNLRPAFSDTLDNNFYTMPQAKYKYITTERYFPSVEKEYHLQNFKDVDIASLLSFYNDVLEYGKNMFTVIDHRGRCLFDTLWDVFGSPLEWRANRNAYNLTMKLKNPFGWTLPVFGAFLFEDNFLEEYLYKTINISTSSAQLINHANDSTVLRENGSALKMIGTTEAHQIGAEAYPVWKTKTGKNCITIFCQVYFQSLAAYSAQVVEIFNVIRITDGSNSIGISAAATVDLANVYLKGFVRTSAGAGGIAMIEKAGNLPAYIKCPGWYDLAISYDETTGQVVVYYAPCTITFTDFLNGETDTAGASDFTSSHSGILTVPSRAIPTFTDVTWNNLRMMEEYVSDYFGVGDTMYMQNIFVFDSFMTAMDFNFMRRLCHYWNAKTSGVWPK